MDILCFHNPDEENGYLSNWYMSQFDVNGIGFSSMEQYMMYKKAVCFRDDVIAEKILETDEVGSIKELGRMVAGYNENYWNGIRQIVVYEGLIAKFSQNDKLREGLITYERSNPCRMCGKRQNLGDWIIYERSRSDGFEQMERSKLIRIHIDDDKRQVVNVITYLKYSYEEGYVKVKAY